MTTNKKGRVRCNGATLLTAFYSQPKGYNKCNDLGSDKMSLVQNAKKRGIKDKASSPTAPYLTSSPHLSYSCQATELIQPGGLSHD